MTRTTRQEPIQPTVVTYEASGARHPVVGTAVTDVFRLDPGRSWLLLTRHRRGRTVVRRDSGRAFLDGVPPATPGYLGCARVLDDWDAHQSVFDLLQPHGVIA